MSKYSIDKLPSEVMTDMAQRHRVLRKRAKMSQTEMADRSGVSLGSLKRFERTGQISLESFLKLLHVLDRLSDFDNVIKPNTSINLDDIFSDKTRRYGKG